LSAVIAPGKRGPDAVLLRLVAQICGLLQRLIVIDSEHRRIERRIEDQSAIFRCEETRPRVAQDRICGEAIDVRQRHTNCGAIDLALSPLDWESDRCVEKSVEIE